MMTIEEHKKRFNQGAKSYTTDRYPGRGQCMRKVLELLDLRQDDVVLDLGCGPGIQLIELAQLIRLGYGVDPAEEMIRRAKAEIAGHANLKFYVGSAQHIPDVIYTAGINKIFSNYALHHLSDQDKHSAIKSLSELLPTGGLLVLGDLMFSDAPEKHYNLYDFVGYGPNSDTPAYVARIEQMFKSAGLKPSTYILNPLVGVIWGRKTQPSAARDAQKAARP
jgi:ubiquinone/menaquinone biosynthesis C-methylase UbiE